ncbi:MAG: bacterial proteasome activator family protein [Actinomycetota bacterium]|nr:bacterial proteasome activator family protein [Actinomycetota bacterium]
MTDPRIVHQSQPDQVDPRVVVVDPDGHPTAGRGPSGAEAGIQVGVEQPAKVMRIGTMIRQLLEEVRGASLDEAGRARLAEIYDQSISELKDGLAPELVQELERLSLPFENHTVPSEAELRVAQAQLVGWLEGLFHGIQTALFAQQLAARAQFDEMRRRALPGAPAARPGPGPTGQYL